MCRYTGYAFNQVLDDHSVLALNRYVGDAKTTFTTHEIEGTNPVSDDPSPADGAQGEPAKRRTRREIPGGT